MRALEGARARRSGRRAPGHLPGPLEQLGLRERLVGQLGRLLEVALRLCGGGERRGALARAGERSRAPSP